MLITLFLCVYIQKYKICLLSVFIQVMYDNMLNICIPIELLPFAFYSILIN